MTLGGAAQVAAAHCPNEHTLDPAVCSQTDPPMPQPAALWPSPHNILRQRLTIFSSEYYQILTAIHLPNGRLSWPNYSKLGNCHDSNNVKAMSGNYQYWH